MFYRRCRLQNPRPPYKGRHIPLYIIVLKNPSRAGGRNTPPACMCQHANGAPDLSRTTGWSSFLGLTKYGSHRVGRAGSWTSWTVSSCTRRGGSLAGWWHQALEQYAWGNGDDGLENVDDGLELSAEGDVI